MRVLGRNDRYYFELEASQPDGPFRLVSLQRLKPGDAVLNVKLDKLEKYRSAFTHRGFTVESVPLPEMLKDGTLKITGGAYRTENGRRLLELTMQPDIPRRGAASYVLPKGQRGGSGIKAVFLPYIDHQQGEHLPFKVTVAPDREYRLVRVEGKGRGLEWYTEILDYEVNERGKTRVIATVETGSKTVAYGRYDCRVCSDF
ncbi:MAG: hypothetical protein KatS3mg110_1454 [Pirellulaceae bacterium]|nr:MAG: hypothetical protein KatS3mg110_1454 [Pirellulaceae bacterium]